MKYLLTILLITFLYGCSNPESHTAETIGKKVKDCCTSLSISKCRAAISPALTEETKPISVFSVSVFERSEQILTW